MPKINILPFSVANLIAAGEVVDRPASVVKELMENSIDAGATSITVEIQHGGVTFLRVSDNGCGMEPADLPTAICRHATSKIRDASDLDSIMTLGFRGEALAATAAVSEMRIISKVKDAEFGAALTVHGGEIVSLEEQGCSNGTTVIVENLFYNVPARRKFLKRDATEAMAVGANVEKVALSHPEISVRFICDGAVKLHTSGDGNLKSVIYAVFGKDYSSRMIYVEGGNDGIRVTGCITRPDNVKATRNYQNYFLNGRYVRSKTACAAVEQAYVSFLPPEKFPGCVLYITLNPETVDVNVHPAKLEVKFSNEKPVFEAIYYTVRAALEENRVRPEILATEEKKSAGFERMTAEQYRTASGLPPTPKRVTNAFVPVEDRVAGGGKNEQLRMTVSEEIADRTPAKKVDSDFTADVAPIQTPVAERQPRRTASESLIRAEIPVRRTVSEALSEKPKVNVCGTNEESDASFPNVLREAPHRDAATVSTEAQMPEPQSAEREEASVLEVPPPMEHAQSRTTSTIAATERAMRKEAIPTYRIIGEAFHSYVLVEKFDPENPVLLLVDKHAAHERIIFERLKAGMRRGLAEGEQVSRLLMLPIAFMLTASEIVAIGQYRTEIEDLGFSFECGNHTVSVSEIPQGIEPNAVEDFFGVIAGRLLDGTGSAALTRDILFEKALYQASCKAAVKAGREYADEHIEYIIDQLMALPDITFCPHGRPVAMEMPKKRIDHRFQRS